MKTPLLTATALASLTLAGCATVPADRVASAEASAPAAVAAPAIPQATGYFAQDSALPFHAPDFTQIKEADYVPAFEQGMAIQKAEVAAIIANPEAPTFENTIVALETSGAALGRVERVFDALIDANTTPGLDAINEQISPRLAAHEDSIDLDPALFARVKAVYDNRAAMSMTPEDARLLERTYEEMVQAGALLTPEQRERVKAINTELSTLTTQFGTAVREATVAGAVFVTDKAELKGLSEADIAAAAKLAADKGKPGQWAIALQNTTQQPLLPSLENRALRERLFKASLHRADGKAGSGDTRLLAAKIATLRAEKAALFGKPDWATYAMWDRMAKTPKTALDFIGQMVPALAATQRSDAAALNAQIRKEGGRFTVQPWDWYRYSNKVKAARFDLDEAKLAEYFQLDKVLEDGVFYMANQLYGLSFARRTDIPVYHPDVWTYTVRDRDGSELGLFYFDPFQRPSKRGGAWMSNFVEQSHLTGNKPVIYNVLNISKAPEGSPQLATFDDVTTIFHEFGHALHGFFADQKYESLSGTATARDFVEYPSQVHEMWATYPQVLANYAKHYKTGETIPAEMIKKLEAAGKFNQGYDFGETVEAALLDMKWHALTPAEAAAIDTPEEVDAFEARALAETGLEVGLVPPRYRTTYFNHIFSDPAGYSAGYYSYLWTQMLDHDSRKWFMDNGGLTRKNGDHYRATVLSRGGTMDYFDMYRAFAGRAPTIRPLLEARGLVRGEAAVDGTSDDGAGAAKISGTGR